MRTGLHVLIFFLLFAPAAASAAFPEKTRDYNYAQVDKHALSYRGKDFGSISKLADSLTRPFGEDDQKARAIYRWITDNIAYDCKAYHNPEQRTDDYEDVLKRRKGVCAGYASLFKVLCDFAGLDCEIVQGYARFSYQGIGDTHTDPNHAWNAVKIGDRWQLVDVTWGSGYTDEKIRKFHKAYSDNYFLTDPKLFVLNHFPKDKKWQLLDHPVSQKKFTSYPYIWDGYYQNKVVAFAPRNGIINTSAGQAVHFKFRTDKAVTISTASIYTDLQGDPQKVDMKSGKKGISFNYIFPEKGEYYISLALNSEYTIVYKVIAK
jgi:transglutaminase/protease-like cytokinesis protein 3